MELLLELLNNPIVQIVGVIAMFLIGLWLLKSIIKAVLFAFFVYLFINVMFLWTPQEFKENFVFAQFLKQDSANKVQEAYENYYEKRQELSPIDEEKVKNEIQQVEEKTKEFINDKVQEVKDKTAEDVLQSLLQN